MELEIQALLMERFSELSFNFFDGTESMSYPYGTFGYVHSLTADNKSTESAQITVQIDLFSDCSGQQQIKEMISEVRQLCKQSFITEDGQVIHTMGITSQVIIEIEEKTKLYHGVVELTLFY